MTGNKGRTIMTQSVMCAGDGCCAQVSSALYPIRCGPSGQYDCHVMSHESFAEQLKQIHGWRQLGKPARERWYCPDCSRRHGR
jgi:hypothetical protein